MAMVELENGFSFRMRPLNENGLRGVFIELPDGTEIRILCLKGNNEACEVKVKQGQQEICLLPTTIEVLWENDEGWGATPFRGISAQDLQNALPEGMLLMKKKRAVGFLIC